MAEYLNLGKLVAIHGLKGELVLKHTLGKKSSLKGLQTVFTEENKNSFIPWFIESTKIKNDEETYIKVEGINTREEAKKLALRKLWIPDEDFKKLSAKSAPVILLGYHIIHEKSDLGAVLEVIEQPHQLLCRIEIQEKEVLIPLHEGSLKNIDHKKKQIIVELPEGLLDIYLQ
jgi:16S rRNA processing protein RimM